MDLTVASFDDPSPFKPKHHFGVESLHRAWINTEGLPEYPDRRISGARRPLGRGDGGDAGVGEAANVCFQPIADTTKATLTAA